MPDNLHRARSISWYFLHVVDFPLPTASELRDNLILPDPCAAAKIETRHRCHTVPNQLPQPKDRGEGAKPSGRGASRSSRVYDREDHVSVLASKSPGTSAICSSAARRSSAISRASTLAREVRRVLQALVAEPEEIEADLVACNDLLVAEPPPTPLGLCRAPGRGAAVTSAGLAARGERVQIGSRHAVRLEPEVLIASEVVDPHGFCPRLLCPRLAVEEQDIRLHPWARMPVGSRRTLGLDVFEQERGRFVDGVLIHEFTLESPAKNPRSQLARTSQSHARTPIDRAPQAQESLHFSHKSTLDLAGRKSNPEPSSFP